MAVKKSGTVQKKKATYQSVQYEGQEFSSKSALIKHLLTTTSKSQAEIAQICGVTAPCVSQLWKVVKGGGDKVSVKNAVKVGMAVKAVAPVKKAEKPVSVKKAAVVPVKKAVKVIQVSDTVTREELKLMIAEEVKRQLSK